MSRNDVTGDRISTKLGTADAQRKFEANFDAIFGKPKTAPVAKTGDSKPESTGHKKESA